MAEGVMTTHDVIDSSMTCKLVGARFPGANEVIRGVVGKIDYRTLISIIITAMTLFVPGGAPYAAILKTLLDQWFADHPAPTPA